MGFFEKELQRRELCPRQNNRSFQSQIAWEESDQTRRCCSQETIRRMATRCKEKGHSRKKELIKEEKANEHASEHPDATGKQVEKKFKKAMTRFAIDMARKRKMEKDDDYNLKNIILSKNITSSETTRKTSSSSATTRQLKDLRLRPRSMPTGSSPASSPASRNCTFSTRRWKTISRSRSSSVW